MSLQCIGLLKTCTGIILLVFRIMNITYLTAILKGFFKISRTINDYQPFWECNFVTTWVDK